MSTIEQEPFVDLAVDNSDEAKRDASLRIIARAALPGWSAAGDDAIDVTQIQGGITNQLYRLIVTSDAASVDRCLVRVFGKNTEVIINREKETEAMRQLSLRDFGPRLHCTFLNGRIEEWLPMTPLQPQQMGQCEPVDFVSLIARELGHMHSLSMPGEPEPQLWNVIALWDHMVTEVNFDDLPDKAKRVKDLDQRRDELAWLRSQVPSPDNEHGAALVAAATNEAEREALAFASEVVYCHNDLLSGNILFREGGDRVRLIDYEYGNFNYRAYDIANHFCEYAGFDGDFMRWYPGLDGQAHFFRAYMERCAPERLQALRDAGNEEAFMRALARIVARFALAAHCFWGIWSVLQARYSPIDFDFVEYSHLRFAGYELQKAACVAASEHATTSPS